VFGWWVTDAIIGRSVWAVVWRGLCRPVRDYVCIYRVPRTGTWRTVLGYGIVSGVVRRAYQGLSARSSEAEWVMCDFL
jgi:hypothetical protein